MVKRYLRCQRIAGCSDLQILGADGHISCVISSQLLLMMQNLRGLLQMGKSSSLYSTGSKERCENSFNLLLEKLQ